MAYGIDVVAARAVVNGFVQDTTQYAQFHTPSFPEQRDVAFHRRDNNDKHNPNHLGPYSMTDLKKYPHVRGNIQNFPYRPFLFRRLDNVAHLMGLAVNQSHIQTVHVCNQCNRSD